VVEKSVFEAASWALTRPARVSTSVLWVSESFSIRAASKGMAFTGEKGEKWRVSKKRNSRNWGNHLGPWFSDPHGRQEWRRRRRGLWWQDHDLDTQE